MKRCLDYIKGKIMSDKRLPIADDPILTGTVLADAIFCAILQHMDLFAATNPNLETYDYLHDPFGALNEVAALLNVDLGLMDMQGKSQVGNPAKSITPFIKHILDEYSTDNNRYQMNFSILRSGRLHQFIENISMSLNAVKSHIKDPNESTLKGMFIFYVMDRNFDLTKNHFGLPHYCLENTTFTTLYCWRIERKRVVRGIGNKFLCQSIIPNIFSDYVIDSIDKFNSELPYYFDDFSILSEIPYFKDLQLKQKYWMPGISILSFLYKKYTAKEGKSNYHEENKLFLQDTLYERFPADVVKIDKMPDNKTLKAFRKSLGFDDVADWDDNILHIKQNHYSRLQKLIEEDSKEISNPFLNFEFSRIEEKINETNGFEVESLCCPFIIYSLPIKEILEKKNIIKKEIDKKLIRIEEKIKHIGRYLSQDLYFEYQEMASCLSSLFFPYNAIKIIDSDTDVSNIGKQENEIRGLITTIKNTVELFSLFPEYIIKRGNTEELVSTVTNLSIAKWKEFFLRYCCAKNQKLIRACIPELCSREDKKICYKKFLSSLRKVYSLHLVNDFKENKCFDNYL